MFRPFMILVVLVLTVATAHAQFPSIKVTVRSGRLLELAGLLQSRDLSFLLLNFFSFFFSPPLPSPDFYISF